MNNALGFEINGIGFESQQEHQHWDSDTFRLLTYLLTPVDPQGGE